MKLATFNVNNVNRRLPILLAWLEATSPDIVCLQELKCTDDRFPAQQVRDAGYEAVWVGQSAWNGVAILAKNAEPVVTRRELPGDASDRQARYLEAAVDGIIVGCLYAPNGNPQPGPKFDYKLRWHERLNAHAKGLVDSGLPVILAGDFNVVPEPRDIYETRSYDNNALVQPAVRSSFRELLEQGWTDALRAKNPDDMIYTFWDYRRKRWERNAGLRIDHILLASQLGTKISTIGVDREVRALEDTSDHAPAWVEFITLASANYQR